LCEDGEDDGLAADASRGVPGERGVDKPPLAFAAALIVEAVDLARRGVSLGLKESEHEAVGMGCVSHEFFGGLGSSSSQGTCRG